MSRSSGRDLVITEEENYFFAFSRYEKDLLELYERGLVHPDFRQNEIRNFVAGGLRDFSVSRLAAKMPWGVPVPGDAAHVMYVWFDALNSYISTLCWGGEDEILFEKYWKGGEVVQYCGKDNNKAQSAIWQAMLLSAGIKNTDVININGHIISRGIKMSKSIGNVISPFDIIEDYKAVTPFPEEVLRFVMCHEVSTYDDSDSTQESIKEAYQAYLQNGIGNQVSRIVKLTSSHLEPSDVHAILEEAEKESLDEKFTTLLENFKINEALHLLTEKSKKLDMYIQEKAPFKLIKEDATKEEAKEILRACLKDLLSLSHHLYFFMPKTSMFIYNAVKENKALEVGIFGRV
jgi:methionyl-tRNA synthetase